jgi:uncharacterized membrane protein
MKLPLENFFISKKQYRLFLLLCLTTLLDFMLIGYRLLYTKFDFGQINSLWDLANTRSTTFLYLCWNLFLAWIPYLIAINLERLPVKKWLAPLALFAWLVFFPNAPYIVTDLLHVHYRAPVPIWYDVMLIFSFAWTGLMLGFLSLLEVQHFLEKRLPKGWVIALVGAAIGLCAFGVYIGRYQRWNSWDLLLNPYQLFWDVAAVLLHPLAYLGTLGLAVVMAGVLGVGYLTLKTLVSER